MTIYTLCITRADAPPLVSVHPTRKAALVELDGYIDDAWTPDLGDRPKARQALRDLFFDGTPEGYLIGAHRLTVPS